MKNLVVLKAQGNLLSVPPNYQAGADILAVVQQGSTPVSSFLTPSGLCSPRFSIQSTIQSTKNGGIARGGEREAGKHFDGSRFTGTVYAKKRE